jgi:hypothetical protein
MTAQRAALRRVKRMLKDHPEDWRVYVTIGGGHTCTVADLHALVALAEQAVEAERPYSLCVACGVNVRVDEDGCCVTCGCDAMGNALESLRVFRVAPPRAGKRAKFPSVIDIRPRTAKRRK